MKMTAPEQLVISAANLVCQEISDLAEKSPPAVAELLGTISERLLDPDFKVKMARGKGSKRRCQQRATEFHDTLGLPMGEFLLRARLEVARLLLISTDLEIDSIPALVSLSRTVFYDRFKERFGKTPAHIKRDRDSAELNIRPLAKATSAIGPLVEISAASFDEAAIVDMQVKIFCELPAHRSRAVLRDTCFDSPALFEAICERSRQEGRRDARRGVELAEMAVASVEGSSSALGDVARSLLARGLARLGTARRLANDHVGAEREIRRAELVLEKAPKAQRPAVRGELLFCRGSLRLFERRFSEAREDLLRAAALCRSTDQRRLEAQAWMQLAATNFYEGDVDAARLPLLSAYKIVETAFEEDSYMRLALYAQLACVHAESGHGDQALVLLPEVRRLAATVGHRAAVFQADWIEATAHKAKGDLPSAEALLSRAHEGFLALGDLGYTAIAALDLALLYDEQECSAKVASLAAEALPPLEALRLPEAVAALAMLRQGIAADQVSSQALLAARQVLLRL